MFLLYCLLTFALAASVGVIVRCLVSAFGWFQPIFGRL